MRRNDPLIIGAGPAGCAAAIKLARGGAQPLLIERTRETGDALCGGFLSWRTLQSLEQLGLTPEQLGGHPVSRLRLFAGKATAEAELPASAIGLSRHRLDSLLIEKAVQHGAAIERGVTARFDSESRTFITGDGASLDQTTHFLATGKHDLPGLNRPRDDDPALGLRLRLPAHPALTRMVTGAIELHLFPGGYAGLVLQEAGDANLCLAVRKSRLAGAGGDPASLLEQLAQTSPELGERLGFLAGTPAIEAIGAVPYGWRCREAMPGLFRLGDQAGVIPSLAGEGNGIALASGMRAARVWLAQGNEGATAYQRELATSLSNPMRLAGWLWQTCERPMGARIATNIMQAAPWLAGRMAGWTRIRD